MSEILVCLWRRSAALLLGLLAIAGPANAQVGAGAVTGLVVDTTGLSLPGVSVAIVSAATNRRTVAMTTDGGQYTFASLVPGLYRLSFDREGFTSVRHDGVRVGTGETTRIDVSLAPAGTREAVVVTTEPLLRRQEPGLGQTIGHEQIGQLPLKGRSFIALAALAPGVAMPPGSSLPRINGGRPRTNEYLFDGISVLQPEPGQVAYFPIVDAIQEFKIESNSPSAEFGRFNGGVVNLTTRSGTNVVHGTGFDFFRHEALHARNLFASTISDKPTFRRQQFGGVVGGPLRRDRTFLFVDFQAQRQRTGRTVISTVPTLLQRQGIFTESIGGRVPTIYDPATTTQDAGGRAGRSPFAGNTIPSERIDPVARALLERFPLPTFGGTANNYQRVGNEVAHQDLFDVRVDHRLSDDGDQGLARVTRFADRVVPVTPLPDGSGATTGTLGPQRTTGWSFASSVQHTWSPHILNQLRVGDTRRRVERSATQWPVDEAGHVRLPETSANSRFADTLPTFSVAGYQHLGSPANTASVFSTSVTELADTVTWAIGRHTVKIGADLRWARLDVVQPPSPTGAFTFTPLFTDLPGTAGTGASFASFLLGQVQTFSIDLQRAPIRNRAHIQEYFIQDGWRITEWLTLNPGLRYTLNVPSYEVGDQAAVFNLSTQTLDYMGRDGVPRTARRLHRNNFGPRLSVTAAIAEDSVARAGYGLVWIEQAGITTPFTTPAFPFLQTVSERTLDNLRPAFDLANGPSIAPLPTTPDAGLGQGVFAVDRNLGSGYVQQWHAAFERQLARRLLIDIAYVGSTITRVGIPDSNINQLTAEQLSLGPALLQPVPNPYVGQIPRSSSLGGPTIPLAQLLKPFPRFTTVSLYRNNVGRSNYHGLEARLEQRWSGGLSYLVSYTRSKLVDDASSVFDAAVLTGPVANFPVADSYDRRGERDLSTGDIPHVFVASGIWDLPAGRGRGRTLGGWAGALVDDWTLTAVLTLQSGMPFAITQATNNNAFAGFGIQRPNRERDPRLPNGERTVQRWFDTAAFSVAPQFVLGSSSRNPVRGPAYRNLDVAAIRRVAVSRRLDMECRIEAFNVTNTPPLGTPNGVLGAAGFGSITSAGDPRVLQLALKVIF